MKKNTLGAVIGIVIYLSVCILVSSTIKPFSEVNFIGPAAGIASAIVITWGGVGIISVVIGTLLYAMYMHFAMQYQISMAIWTISCLAIVFQAVWAKQLSYKLVVKQRWLESRATLLSFILRVGVVASIVAAISSLIVSSFSLSSFQLPLPYVFSVGWSSSLLVAVFATPTLLFTKGQQHLSLSKRLFVIVAAILGSLAIAILFKISQQNHQHKRLDNFETATSGFVAEFTEELNHIQAQITALSAFFDASDYVTANEFHQFASHIYQENTSIRALEWVPVIFDSDKANFEHFANGRLGTPYKIFDQNKFDGNVSPVLGVSFPVFYLYPRNENLSALGLNLNSHSAKVLAVQRAMNSKLAVASAPLTLIQDESYNPGMLVFKRIVEAPNLNSFGYVTNMQGERIAGFVVAVIQFDEAISRIADKYGDVINVGVNDTTNREAFIIREREPENASQLKITHYADVFGRQWVITLSEATPWIAQGKNWQTWAILFGGTVGGLLFQLLILMMAAYSTELSYKVGLKTRELILAKELSDKENETKTRFLQTLSTELGASLSSIVEFLAKARLSKHANISPSLYNDLSAASERLGQLVDSVNDLSLLNLHATPVENRIFDFYAFISEIERHYASTDIANAQRIKIITDNNSPNHIKTDPSLLKKMLLALRPNLVELFDDYNIQLSMKPHIHQYHATLFMTCSAIDYREDGSHPLPIEEWFDKDLANYSTSMALVKELCLLLGGDVKLSKLPSGSAVLTLSIRMIIEDQGSKVSEIAAINHKSHEERNIILVEEPLSTNFEITPILLGLNYQVEIIDDVAEIFERLSEEKYELIIIDNVTSRPFIEQLEQRLLESGEASLPPILGVYRGIESRQLPREFKHCISDFVTYPVDEERLHKAIISLGN